jgi:hypothetical protein
LLPLPRAREGSRLCLHPLRAVMPTTAPVPTQNCRPTQKRSIDWGEAEVLGTRC